MKIIVTGASGFIGVNLCAKLQEEGHDVLKCDTSNGNIYDTNYFDFIEAPESYDLVYHLAGKTFVPNSWKHPLEFNKINCIGTQNTLNFCVKNELPIIYISSYIYDDPEYLPIDENHPLKALNPYSLSKKLAEEICRFYGDNYSLRYNIVRPFNVYGNGQEKSFLIPHIIDQINTDTKINLRDLAPRRDFIYIDDMISALSILKTNFNNKIYNVGSGESHSVKEVVSMAQEIAKSNLEVIPENITRKNELDDSYADTSAIYNDFGWKPIYSLEQGLSEIFLLIPPQNTST